MTQATRKGRSGDARSGRKRVSVPRGRSRRHSIPSLSAEQAEELRIELYRYAKDELNVDKKGATYLANMFSKPVHV